MFVSLANASGYLVALNGTKCLKPHFLTPQASGLKPIGAPVVVVSPA
jgi:hypothetical protein